MDVSILIPNLFIHDSYMTGSIGLRLVLTKLFESINNGLSAHLLGLLIKNDLSLGKILIWTSY